VVNTTIANYIRGEENNILRNRKLTAIMREKGRISLNWSGTKMDWKVRYRRGAIQGFSHADTMSFKPVDRWKTAELEWRGYNTTELMTKLDRLKNASTQAIINTYSELAKSLLDDMEEAFGDELYIDGNAAGNSKRIHGIESFMGAGASIGGLVRQPNDTFAGLSTNLGFYGGNWTGDWPTGKGDAHYDFWSPLLVDYTGSGWAASTKTWPNTCLEALRFATIKTMKNKTPKGRLDMHLLNDEMYRQALEAVDSKVRINAQHNASNSTLVKLGYTDVFNYDGVDVTFEYGTPVNTGYGFNCDQMHLCSMQNALFVPDGPDWDIASKAWRLSLDFFGNCRWNCRYFHKLFNYTAP
jgi:hypothetical protein